MEVLRPKAMGISEKCSQICAVVSFITLIFYCFYGVIYDYFDTVVCFSFVLGMLCAEIYAVVPKKWTSFLNLLSVISLSFGIGLFFLNSYPVWADRLNNIEMYGSRGTLVPVVAIILLTFVCILIEIVSCFTLNRRWRKP